MSPDQCLGAGGTGQKLRSNCGQDAVKKVADKSSVTNPGQNDYSKMEEKRTVKLETKGRGQLCVYNRFRRLECSPVRGIALGQPLTSCNRNFQKD